MTWLRNCVPQRGLWIGCTVGNRSPVEFDICGCRRYNPPISTYFTPTPKLPKLRELDTVLPPTFQSRQANSQLQRCESMQRGSCHTLRCRRWASDQLGASSSQPLGFRCTCKCGGWLFELRCCKRPGKFAWQSSLCTSLQSLQATGFIEKCQAPGLRTRAFDSTKVVLLCISDFQAGQDGLAEQDPPVEGASDCTSCWKMLEYRQS